jgi:hypothetical protein
MIYWLEIVAPGFYQGESKRSCRLGVRAVWARQCAVFETLIYVGAIMMASRSKAISGVFLFLTVGLWVMPAGAVVLPWYDEVGTPYNNWCGTAYLPPAQDTAVAGYVEWAVYAPGQFPFSGDGYTAPANEYTYVYQVFGTGSTAITNFSAEIFNAADTIGAFSDPTYFPPLTDEAPTAPYNLYPPPGEASWDFEGISAGGSSWALVYASRNAPTAGYGYIVNHGTYEYNFEGTYSDQTDYSLLPAPSAEPASLWLLATGLGLLLARWWRR